MADDRTRLGRTIGHRQRPLRERRSPVLDAAVGRGPATGPTRLGDLGGRSRTFSMATGLSMSSRRALGLVTPDAAVGHLPVAPPPEWDEAMADAASRTGDPALDRLLASRPRRAGRDADRAPQRGLRSVIRRRGTAAGPDTGPSGAARRLRSIATPTVNDPSVRQVVGGDGGGPRPDARPRATPRGAVGPGSGPSGRAAPPPGRSPGDRAGRNDLRSVIGAPPDASSVVPAPAAMAAMASSPSGLLDAAAAAPDSAPSTLSGPGRRRLPTLAEQGAGSPRHLPRSGRPLGSGRVVPTRRTVASTRPPAVPGTVGGAVAPTMAGRSREVVPPLRDVPHTGAAAPSGGRPVGPPSGLMLTSLPAGGPGAVATTVPTPRRQPSASGSGPIPPTAPRVPPAGVGAVASLLLAASGAASSGAATGGGSTRTSAAPSPVGSRSPDPFRPDPARATTPPAGPAPRAFGGPRVEGASRALRSLPSLGDVVPPPGAPLAAPAPAPASAPATASSSSATGRAAGRATADPVGAPSAAPHTVAAPTSGTSPAGARAEIPPRSSAAPAAGDRLGRHDAPTSPVAGAPVAPVAPVAPAAALPPLPDHADPADRFLAELARGEARRPAPSRLPRRFEPMARSILPAHRRARVSTDEASRRALAAVGKVAATTDDVIHLARPLDGTTRSHEVLAHELTHVGAPSPAPRFFDDDRDSPEERRARQVGELMARAPVGTPPAAPPPSGATTTAPATAAPAAGRPPRPSGPPPGGGSGPSAPATAASPWSGGSSRPSATSPGSVGSIGGHRRGAPTGSASPPPVSGGASVGGSGGGTVGGVSSALPVGALSPHPSTPASGDGPTIDVERLLDALEARVLRELERRGRRWPRPL